MRRSSYSCETPYSVSHVLPALVVTVVVAGLSTALLHPAGLWARVIAGAELVAVAGILVIAALLATSHR